MIKMKMELPLGFGMALAQNETAMQRFESMTQEQKEAIVAQTSNVRSKSEMRAFVDRLASGK